MDFDFSPDSNSLQIPAQAYRPIKRCAHCTSVYLGDTHCESCGKKINIDILGEPFSSASFYQIKVRYLDTFYLLIKLFPIFENKNSPEASTYKKKLFKRFKDLILGFTNNSELSIKNRQLFYFEIKLIAEELINYDFGSENLINVITKANNEGLLFQDLLESLKNMSISKKQNVSLFESFLNYQFFGLVKIKFLINISLFVILTVMLAVKFKYFFIS